MLRRTCIQINFLLFCVLIFNSYTQTSQIHGYVLDAYTNKALPGAIILLNDELEINTDINGYFEFRKLKYDHYKIEVKFIGYYKQEQNILLNPQNDMKYLIFHLNYGPQFSKSTKYINYHQSLANQYQNDNTIFRIFPKEIYITDRDYLKVKFNFVNHSDTSIFITKYDFGCYISDSLGNFFKWIPQYIISGLSYYYDEDDVIELKRKSKYLHECGISLDDKNYYRELKKHPYIVLTYHFDISQPVCTLDTNYPEFPKDEEYDKLEEIYCKLLRINIQSKPIKIKQFIK